MLVQDGLGVLLTLAASGEQRVMEGGAAGGVTALLLLLLLDGQKLKHLKGRKDSYGITRGKDSTRRNLCLSS